MLSDEDLNMIRTAADNDNILKEDVGNIILGTRNNPSAIKIRKALVNIQDGRDVYDKFMAITKAGVERKVNVDGVKISMIEAVKKNISEKIKFHSLVR